MRSTRFAISVLLLLSVLATGSANASPRYRDGGDPEGPFKRMVRVIKKLFGGPVTHDQLIVPVP